METKNEKAFKAVEFMRNIREEMSALYYNDSERYFEEIKQAMDDFMAQRERTSAIENIT